MNKDTNKKRADLKKIFINVVLLALLISVTAIAIIYYSIYSNVKQATHAARLKFPGDSVQALIACIQSEDISFKEKNKAVWALGQIGDKRALQPLEELKTLQKCEKPCSGKSKICQYELQHAIDFCSERFSATRWMYSRL